MLPISIKHWKMINQLYSKAPYFKLYKEFFQYIYLDKTWNRLSELNQTLIQYISREFLRIDTEFQDSRQYNLQAIQLDRLLDLLKQVNADLYISGPTARAYIDNREERFQEEGIILEYKDYSGYPEYPQLYSPFDHSVSILDLLFNCGSDASHYIWEWRTQNSPTLAGAF